VRKPQGDQAARERAQNREQGEGDRDPGHGGESNQAPNPRRTRYRDWIVSHGAKQPAVQWDHRPGEIGRPL
jgi:hypothetical protein